MALRILIVHQAVSQTRHFESLFKELLERGHRITVQAEYGGYGSPEKPDYLASFQGLSLERLVLPRGFWGKYAKAFRATHNYLLYAHPKFDRAAVFRSRAYQWTDPFLRRWVPEFGKPPAWFSRFLEATEAATPAPRNIVGMIRRGKYDVVLVSPLIFYQNLYHHDYVKAARSMGIPVGFPVFSWDNLTTKGTIQVMPDRIWVWNDIQRRELEEYHGVSGDRVRVMGAWRFEDFRDLSPSVSREDFCRNAGLDPAAPIIAYLGSSPAIAPEEGAFVERWLAAVRSSEDSLVRDANVIVRAHPRNFDAWKSSVQLKAARSLYFQEPATVSFWDAQGLYDLLAFSHACVGLNTSAMLEAAILKRPVHTVHDGSTQAGHDGTVHFEYLTTAGGGLLYQDADLESHVASLSKPLRAPLSQPDARAEAFFRAFIDDGSSPATPTVRLANDLEEFARLATSPLQRSMQDRTFAVALRIAVLLRLLHIKSEPQYGIGGDSLLTNSLMERVEVASGLLARVDPSRRLEAYLVTQGCLALGHKRMGPLSIEALPMGPRLVGYFGRLSIGATIGLLSLLGARAQVSERIGPRLVRYDPTLPLS